MNLKDLIKINSVIILLGCLLLISSAFAGDIQKKMLEPGEEISNDFQQPIYLVLEVKTGEKFKNQTKSSFKVMSKNDFLKLHYSYKLESQITRHQLSVESKTELLDNIEKQLQDLNSKEKESSNRPRNTQSGGEVR